MKQRVDYMDKLTANEITALKCCLRYDNRKHQLEDSFSEVGEHDFAIALGWTSKQVAGLLSSLYQKGMGYGVYNDAGYHTFYISEEGVNAIFDIIEADQQKDK